MKSNIVKGKLLKALKKVIKDDRYLLVSKINEPCITHRLANYLEKYFPGHDIDCEYNRDGLGLGPKKLESLKGVRVYPDIIIHKRGTKNCQVVIEAKKTNTIKRYEKKLKLKLQAFKTDLGYKKAYIVIFPVGKDISATYKSTGSLIQEVV